MSPSSRAIITVPDAALMAQVESADFSDQDGFSLDIKFDNRERHATRGKVKHRFPIVKPQTQPRYNPLIDQSFKSPAVSPLSTFSVDTYRASYTTLRNSLNRRIQVNPDSVRIEELINAFSYEYAEPDEDHPFSVNVETAGCPWNTETRLVKIGLKGKEIHNSSRPATNLVLLCDVSGSMDSQHKLGYLKASLMALVENLGEKDTISIVTYAGAEGVALSPTKENNRGRHHISNAITNLRAEGNTNGKTGIKLAYALTKKHFKKKGVNSVILASDGDFHTGVSGDEEILKIVKKGTPKGIYLTVLGFGHDNLNDGMLEQITNYGNGQYFFIDTQQEGHRFFSKEFTRTLFTIAKDVKIQVEFNPEQVAEYRLIEYANRQPKDEEFNNYRIDAEEIIPGKAKPKIDNLRYGSPQARTKVSAINKRLNTVIYEQSKSYVLNSVTRNQKGHRAFL